MELEQRVLMLPVESISPNPSQPRQGFNPAGLEALAASIRENGILQPLTVRQQDENHWELVAGERRLRAAKLAGLAAVPCLEWAANDAGAALLALVENLQREDLHYFEEAEAIAAFLEKTGMTQGAAAKKLGLSPSTLANKLRILRLTPVCRKVLSEGGLTERHARALLQLDSEDERLAAANHAAAVGLNVAQTEQYVQRRIEALRRPPMKGRRTYIIKDVRLFLNSVDHGLQMIQSAGIDAKSQREETDEAIILTIRIPRDAHVKAPALLQDCNVIPPKTCYTDVS